MCPGCDLDVAWLLGGSGQAPGPGQFLQEQLAAPPQTPRGIYWERRACREITKKTLRWKVAKGVQTPIFDLKQRPVVAAMRGQFSALPLPSRAHHQGWGKKRCTARSHPGHIQVTSRSHPGHIQVMQIITKTHTLKILKHFSIYKSFRLVKFYHYLHDLDVTWM